MAGEERHRDRVWGAFYCAGQSCLALLAAVLGSIWLLAITAAIAIGDIQIARGLVRQIQAMTWPTAPGTITHSGVKDRATVDLRYAWQHNGAVLTGSRYRFDEGCLTELLAQAVVREHPVGCRVAVYYNPDDPRESVLQPGLCTASLLFPLCLGAFNAGLIIAWTSLAGWCWRRVRYHGTGGVPVRRYDSQWRLSCDGSLGAGAATLLVSGFLSTLMGIGLAVAHNHVVLPFAFEALALDVLFAASALIYRASRRDGAARELVVDREQELLWLPRNGDRLDAEPIAWADIESVEVRPRPKRLAQHVWQDEYYVVLVYRGDEGQRVIRRSDGNRVEHTLAQWSRARPAHRFAQWLRAALSPEPAPALNGVVQPAEAV